MLNAKVLTDPRQKMFYVYWFLFLVIAIILTACGNAVEPIPTLEPQVAIELPSSIPTATNIPPATRVPVIRVTATPSPTPIATLVPTSAPKATQSVEDAQDIRRMVTDLISKPGTATLCTPSYDQNQSANYPYVSTGVFSYENIHSVWGKYGQWVYVSVDAKFVWEQGDMNAVLPGYEGRFEFWTWGPNLEESIQGFSIDEIETEMTGTEIGNLPGCELVAPGGGFDSNPVAGTNVDCHINYTSQPEEADYEGNVVCFGIYGLEFESEVGYIDIDNGTVEEPENQWEPYKYTFNFHVPNWAGQEPGTFTANANGEPVIVSMSGLEVPNMISLQHP